MPKSMTALLLLLTLSISPPARADAAADLERLAWLAGCWKLEGSEPGTLEQWMPLAGGTLLGMSRTVRKGRTVAHEFMQIRADAAGNLAFMAQPSGQAFAAFPLLRLSDEEAVFENAQHDFPQRVVYAREGANRLKARIEGQRQGQGPVRVIPFPMERVSCEAR